MQEEKKFHGHRGAKKIPVTVDLDQPGILRVGHLLYLLKTTSDTFYKKLKVGTIPQPTGRDPRPYWTNEVIRNYLNGPAVITAKAGKTKGSKS